MMVGTGLGVWLNYDRTGPQLTGASSRVSNGCSPRHSRSLGRVHVQISRADNLYAMFFPVQSFVARPLCGREYP
jgi:hypothetical protein